MIICRDVPNTQMELANHATQSAILVKTLDHVNIRTCDVKGTVRFFSDVLGLTAGQAPGMNANEFAWMFSEAGAPIFHVQLDKNSSLATTTDSPDCTGAIHHIALDCAGHDATVTRLNSLGVAYRQNEGSMANLRQIFLVDPNRILFELNFREYDQ